MRGPALADMLWAAKNRAIVQGPWEGHVAQFIQISILGCGLLTSPTRPPDPHGVVSLPARPSRLPALSLLPCIPQTFFSRSSLWKVSRNRRTWSLRSWSMLRASMARPRNSSTSSSGFRASWAPRLTMGHRFYQVHEGKAMRQTGGLRPQQGRRGERYLWSLLPHMMRKGGVSVPAAHPGCKHPPSLTVP